MGNASDFYEIVLGSDTAAFIVWVLQYVELGINQEMDLSSDKYFEIELFQNISNSDICLMVFGNKITLCRPIWLNLVKCKARWRNASEKVVQTGSLLLIVLNTPFLVSNGHRFKYRNTSI